MSGIGARLCFCTRQLTTAPHINVTVVYPKHEKFFLQSFCCIGVSLCGFSLLVRIGGLHVRGLHAAILSGG